MNSNCYSNWLVAPAAARVIPVTGQGLFAVNRIVCLGRNYYDHVIEMQEKAVALDSQPVIFMKPASALASNNLFHYPQQSKEVHHEVELVLAIGRGQSSWHPKLQVIGAGIGFDMTCRDLQAIAKRQQAPWEVAKAFPDSALVQNLVPVDFDQAGPQEDTQEGAQDDTQANTQADTQSNIQTGFAQLAEYEIGCKVNGKLRQRAKLGQMMLAPPNMLQYIDRLLPLAAGDLIFTGTPAGVGAVGIGDELYGYCQGIGETIFKVVAADA